MKDCTVTVLFKDEKDYNQRKSEHKEMFPGVTEIRGKVTVLYTILHIFVLLSQASITDTKITTDKDESQALTYNSHFHANQEKLKNLRVTASLPLPECDIS